MGTLTIKAISSDELKGGTKYYFVNKYESREYIGVVTEVMNRNFMVRVYNSYDPYRYGVPHMGLRCMISDFMDIYEMVPVAQRNMESRAFHTIMNDLIPGFNVNYL